MFWVWGLRGKGIDGQGSNWNLRFEQKEKMKIERVRVEEQGRPWLTSATATATTGLLFLFQDVIILAHKLPFSVYLYISHNFFF